MSQKLINEKTDNSSRTSLDEACESIIKFLLKEQKLYSITGLARDLKLHRNTVEKCIQLLIRMEELALDEYRLKLNTVDNKKIIALEKRIGLLSYPQEIQNLIIKKNYFPDPSSETSLLVDLYLKGAISFRKGIKIEKKNDEIINKLVKQGQVKISKTGMIWLTDEGIIVAKGTLKIYPELKHKSSKKK
jgi:DNA-binding transcriptional regulator YhcF (GntR family)